mmetsp:Transcript_20358/g.23511  ORF Transcript_20358/g.23511 Transcript_20358/m.23511 type:complete len:149 (+) Transcript_20358:81-527(+)
MIVTLLIVVSKFYNLNLQNDQIWNDIFLNIITCLVCRKYVYFTLYNLVTLSITDRINTVQCKLQNLQSIRPKDLGASDILNMCPILRYNLCGAPMSSEIIQEIKLPYLRTIQALIKLREVEAPIIKLEIIHKIFTKILPNELRNFWQG